MIFEQFPNLSYLELTCGSRHRGVNYCREGFGMTLNDAQLLSNSICLTKNLNSLSLPCNLIDIEVMQNLIRGLLINTSITCLDLSYNCLDDECALKLARVLIRSRNLVDINLAENFIGEKATLLFKALKHNKNTVMESINLRHNRISDDTASKIWESYIPLVPTLKRVNFSANSLSVLVIY